MEERRTLFCAYLRRVVNLSPVPGQTNIFLNVKARVRELSCGGLTGINSSTSSTFMSNGGITINDFQVLCVIYSNTKKMTRYMYHHDVKILDNNYILNKTDKMKI